MKTVMLAIAERHWESRVPPRDSSQPREPFDERPLGRVAFTNCREASVEV